MLVENQGLFRDLVDKAERLPFQAGEEERLEREVRMKENREHYGSEEARRKRCLLLGENDTLASLLGAAMDEEEKDSVEYPDDSDDCSAFYFNDFESGVIGSFSGEFAFLGNFYPCYIEYNGKAYLSVEHAFQAQKATNEADREFIRKARNCWTAKQRGNFVELRSDWEDVKVTEMKLILEVKFSDTELRMALLATGHHTLIGGNTWHDTFWGKCPGWRGKGENYLGLCLMLIREEIRNEVIRKRG